MFDLDEQVSQHSLGELPVKNAMRGNRVLNQVLSNITLLCLNHNKGFKTEIDGLEYSQSTTPTIEAVFERA